MGSPISKENEISILFTGDIEINREKPKEVFDKVIDEFESVDLRFGFLESSLSNKGEPVHGKIVMRHDPMMIDGYIAGGFDVLGFATNHCLDYGFEPFVDTLKLLEEKGIKYTGAGRNIRDARTPVVIESKGTKIGFLTYILNIPMGWGAQPERPGVAPIRQDPLYGPPYVNEEDLESMVEDVKETKKNLDVLVSTFHWGSSQSRTLTLAQKAVAHAAIDAGVDLVVGSHPHILQGIEVYNGKAIFYNLGNLVLDHDHPMFMPTVKESILLKCTIHEKKIRSLSFSPTYIENDGRPAILSEEDKKFKVIQESMEKMSEKLGTNFSLEANRFILSI
ncbi:MAG: CapA family protein [Nitrospinota bacterium]|nr:CapA family protein [Nitrospinota bacterium]